MCRAAAFPARLASASVAYERAAISTSAWQAKAGPQRCREQVAVPTNAKQLVKLQALHRAIGGLADSAFVPGGSSLTVYRRRKVRANLVKGRRTAPAAGRVMRNALGLEGPVGRTGNRQEPPSDQVLARQAEIMLGHPCHLGVREDPAIKLPPLPLRLPAFSASHLLFLRPHGRKHLRNKEFVHNETRSRELALTKRLKDAT